MQNVLIVGNSDYAKLIYDYVSDDFSLSVQGFTVDGAYIDKKTINGKPVLPFDEVSRVYPPENTKLVLAIGYTKLGEVRKTMYYKYKKLGYDFINYIHVGHILFKR